MVLRERTIRRVIPAPSTLPLTFLTFVKTRAHNRDRARQCKTYRHMVRETWIRCVQKRQRDALILNIVRTDPEYTPSVRWTVNGTSAAPAYTVLPSFSFPSHRVMC